MLLSSSKQTMSHTHLLEHNPAERYDLTNKIGQGGFGYVYKAIDKVTNTTVACKLINLEDASEELEDVHQEIAVMSNCNCKQLTKYHGSFLSGTQLWIVMEYLEGGSLSDLLSFSGPLDEAAISYVMKELLIALDYLHGERKIHRDVKAGNILVSANGDIKLADFGVTGQLTESVSKRKTRVGTPYWMAPEVISETSYDASADIWSVGITAMELIDGRPPYASSLPPLKAIFYIPKNPAPVLVGPRSPEFKNFISACLQKDPNDRLSASSLLKHPFVSCAKVTQSLIQRITQRVESVEEVGKQMSSLESKSDNPRDNSLNSKTIDSGWNFDTLTRGSFHSGDDSGIVLDTSFSKMSHGSVPIRRIGSSNSISNSNSTHSSTGGGYGSSGIVSHRNVMAELMKQDSNASIFVEQDEDDCQEIQLAKDVNLEDVIEEGTDGSGSNGGDELQEIALQDVTHAMPQEEAAECLSRVLDRNQDVPLSVLFLSVVEPSIRRVVEGAEEMRADSDSARHETAGLIQDLTRALMALDKHTDGGLISDFTSTVMAYMVAELEDCSDGCEES